MPELIKTQYDLSNLENLVFLEENSKRDLDDLKVIYHPNENAVEAFYEGLPLKNTCMYHDYLNDTIILDAEKHGSLLNYHLAYFGAIFHIGDIEKSNDRIDIPIGGMPQTRDYISWQISWNDAIYVQLTLHQADIKSEKIIYSGTRHQKLLKKLKKNNAVQIINDGIMDAADLAFYRNQLNQSDSSIPKVINQFGPIFIILNVGKPETVSDLIKYVKKFKKNLYRNIK